jgi:hypothetical protein
MVRSPIWTDGPFVSFSSQLNVKSTEALIEAAASLASARDPARRAAGEGVRPAMRAV